VQEGEIKRKKKIRDEVIDIINNVIENKEWDKEK